jgi:TFIIF-interacting CTD phosphatase-like protein
MKTTLKVGDKFKGWTLKRIDIDGFGIFVCPTCKNDRRRNIRRIRFESSMECSECTMPTKTKVGTMFGKWRFLKMVENRKAMFSCTGCDQEYLRDFYIIKSGYSRSCFACSEPRELIFPQITIKIL